VKSDAVPGGPLVLALEQGAIEAEVTPVARGEAFAVDVGDLRVAVHGTHLRVARAGTRVVVDLTEGVVSIGAPPKSGSTYGALVTAPAHVELDLGEGERSLKVDHTPSAVRPASAVRDFAPSGPRVASLPAASPVDAPARTPLAHPPTVLKKEDHKSDTTPAPQVDPHPEQTIVAAVKACERESKPLPTGVTVTVTSTLQLKVGDDGIPESARFDPPLPPEVQTCAAATIYRVRFDKPGSVQIPFELQK
jgi:hypothetical protein